MAVSRPGHQSRPVVVAASLCFALLGAASMTFYEFGLLLPRSRELFAARGLATGNAFGNDFYPLWLTARESVRGRNDPYSSAMTRQIQIGLFGRPLDPHNPTDMPDQHAFAHPAFVVLLFWPASQVSFPDARVALAALLGVFSFATIFLWLRAFDWRLSGTWVAVVILLVFSSLPVMEALYACQVGLMAVFLVASSVLALVRGHLRAAGILIGLSTIKPQTSALLIFYLLLWSLYDWRTRRRFVGAFVATALALVGASLAFWPHWISSWVHAVIAYRAYTPPPLVRQLVEVLAGAHASLPSSLIIAALLAVAIMISWRNRNAAADAPAFWKTLSLLLAITVVVLLPGQAVYDHVILLPAIFLLLRYWRELRAIGPVPRILAILGAAVLFWPWVAATVVVLAHWLFALDFSAALFSLPLRTVASLPFVVLALLAYVRKINLVPNRESV